MGSVYRVVQIKSSQEMNSFINLESAVGEISGRATSGRGSWYGRSVKSISADECCRVLRKWLADNKQLGKLSIR
jgi:hypothetical protein